MILCVVADGQNALASNSTDFLESFEEFPEGLAVECFDLAAKYKSAVPQSHCGEIADALSRRMMLHDRVLDLRRNPHAAARSLLLKVHFVQSPEVHRIVGHQLAEFFLCAF